MIRPWLVTVEGAQGLVHTTAPYAAIAKYAIRHAQHLTRQALIAGYDTGTFRAVPARPYRITEPDKAPRVVYATGVPAVDGLVEPARHYDGLVALENWTLCLQALYVWPAGASNTTAKDPDRMTWLGRYAPEVYDRVRQRASRGKIPLSNRGRRRVAAALCLAMLDPGHAPPRLDQRFRHPGEFDRKAGQGGARGRTGQTYGGFEARHPDHAPSLIRRLRNNIGPTLTYEAHVLHDIRTFVECYGYDPEDMSWNEIRALWMRGEEGLANYRTLGYHPTDRFEDKHRLKRKGEYLERAQEDQDGKG